MPVIQSNFGTDFAVGYPGMVANGETSNRISRSIEDADGIGFGRAAFRGAGDHGCTKVPAAGAFLGIAITDKGVPLMSAGQAVDTYPQHSNVPLMQRGVIWVLAAAAFADGDPVSVAADGSFVAGGTAGSVALPGFVADMTVAPGQLVRITNNRAPA